MDKFLFLTIVIICINITTGFDKRLQNANLDFINFEGNNRKPVPPQNLPNNQDPLKLNVPTSSSTTVRPIIQNQPIQPKQPVAAATTQKTTISSNVVTTATTPKPGTLVRDYDSRISGTTSNIRPNVNQQNNQDQTDTKPKNDFPTLPKTGSGQQSPSSTTGASWASIAAGKKPEPGTPVIGNVPSTPTSPNRNMPNSPVGNVPNVPGSPVRNAPNVPNSPIGSIPNGPGSPVRNSPNVPSSPTGNIPTIPSLPTRGPNRISNSPNSPTGNKNQLQYPTLAPPLRTTQKSTDTRTTAAPLIATDKELSDISEALLTKDVNNPSKYLTINIQRKTSSFSKDDLAPEPLFTVDPAVWNIPTIAAMKTLLDNYEQDVTVNEYITPQERNEENTFMDAIMATSVMRHLMTFLKDKGIVTPDPKQQRDVLKQTWFNMYSRGQGKIGSSGFEHIFLSEIKNNEISGLHNWLYFYLEEAASRANYLGHLKMLDFSNKGSILKLHFSLKGIDKPVDTMFVGTSPELEMALYTLCFYTRPDQACPLTLGGQKFNLRTHTFRYRSKNMIGSAFPEI